MSTITLESIDYTKLKVIGCGKYTVCLTDGTYAIKIGRINTHNVTIMRLSGKYSVPVYYYEQKTAIPDQMIRALQSYNNKLPMYGGYGVLRDYIRNGTADVMICGLAIPIINHNDEYSQEYINELYKKAGRLAARYKKATGFSWYDSHPYNVGIYNRRLVILDF